MKLTIVIPAYNEEKRIEKTLDAYLSYFSQKTNIETTLLVVPNGCTDRTIEVVKAKAVSHKNIVIKELLEGGKGLAIKAGFEQALSFPGDLIGFVDADMATQPRYFYDLVQQLGEADGIIASRYMPGSVIQPPRPRIKRWGSKFVYEPLVTLLLGMHFYDYQCGAKLFRRKVIEVITPYLSIPQWAIDLELLYLCKLFGFTIKEVPTTWYDQAGSKLSTMKSGLRMLRALFEIRFRNKGKKR